VSETNHQQVLPYQIDPEIRMVYNPELKGVYLFVPGIMAMILMLISALMTSVSIVREKELGTMEVLLVSPLKPLQIIIGKVNAIRCNIVYKCNNHRTSGLLGV